MSSEASLNKGEEHNKISISAFSHFTFCSMGLANLICLTQSQSSPPFEINLRDYDAKQFIIGWADLKSNKVSMRVKISPEDEK